MKVENLRVFNFEGAVRGVRNPKDSWHLSDSKFGLACWEEAHEICNDVAYVWATAKYGDLGSEELENKANEFSDWLWNNGILHQDNHIVEYAFIGPKDMNLMKVLTSAGNEHRKFNRQMFVCCDITLPLQVWKEADKYQVGTTTNSCSTMHKIQSKPFCREMFEVKNWDGPSGKYIDNTIVELEKLRQEFNATGDKEVWRAIIEILPESFLQKRTWTGNYEVVRSMCHQRKGHKLYEWHQLIEAFSTLPYAEDLIF